MSSQTYIETGNKSLFTVLEELRKGHLQVPPFQRDFVWDRKDIISLFDSIKKNYPIGSILIWRPDKKMEWGANKFVGGLEIPVSDKFKSYILDGYQRMSCIFGCLTNPDEWSLAQDYQQRADFFNLYYNLEDESFVYPSRFNGKQDCLVPLHVLMNTSDFRKFSRNNLETRFRGEQLDLYLNRADQFSRTLLDYKLAVIDVAEASLKDAVNIFSRINSKGTEISYDYMVSALSYDSDFNFSNEIDQLKTQLDEYNFGSIPRNTLFRCFQSAFDQKLYIDQTDLEAIASRPDFKDTVTGLLPSVVKAVKFLNRNICMVHPSLLPYTAQLIFITTFFHNITQPTRQQLKDLENWFWVTTYSNYFTIYSLANQRRAFSKLWKYINGESDEILFVQDEMEDFKAMPFPGKMNRSSVRNKALILFQLNRAAKKTPGLYAFYHSTKIFKDADFSPENMIYGFSHADVASVAETVAGSLNRDSNTLSKPSKPLQNDAYSRFFIPQYVQYLQDNNPDTVSRFLNKRRELLRNEERMFVESLGPVVYT